MTQQEEEDASSFMRQRLMAADEVYVYKIPPLKSAGGHRAEDWNLGKPLQTCRLVVERRGDDLYMDFFKEDGADGADSRSGQQAPPQLFCQSHFVFDPTGKMNAMKWLDPVVDSSRYFVTQIQGAGNKQATIGFGFRDRDQAVDLREAMQQYEKAMQRQHAAASGGDEDSADAAGFAIPKLGADEKIRVDSKTGKTTVVKTGGGGGSGATPLLKRAPPPPADVVPSVASLSATDSNLTTASSKAVEKITFSMADIDLDAAPAAKKDKGGDDSDEDSDGAVYEGTEEQWAHEFEMK